MSNPIKVFISYSHDSDEHRDFVFQFSKRLRDQGLDAQIDRYVNGHPAEHWPNWMENKVEWADFVLLICTPLYLKRFRGKDTEGGRGVTFEGVIITQHLYDNYYKNTKFLPVIPAGGKIEDVPTALKTHAYFLNDDYKNLYRVLTDQHATPAPSIGNINILSSIEYPANSSVFENNVHSSPYETMQPTHPPTIGKVVEYNELSANNTSEFHNNTDNTLWLAFSIEQKNGKVQAECLDDHPLSTNPLPLENLAHIKALFELLFGDPKQCLNFLHQFPATENITQLEESNIRIRLMTDDPELAMLPWQQMQCPDTGKSVTDFGWVIEVEPQCHRYREGFSALRIETPLLIIPDDPENSLSCNLHHSLVQDYINSYFQISGMIPRVTTADQVSTEIKHHQPDFIYLYCRIHNDNLQLDNSQISLQALADVIEQADLPRPPCLFINLIGKPALSYPKALLNHAQLVWLQIERSQSKARKCYEPSLLHVLENLSQTHDLVSLINDENASSEHSVYFWIKGRSPVMNIASDSNKAKQQLRAALLTVMLGRESLKGSMSHAISNSRHRRSRQVLIYAIAGDKTALPFEFPAQLRHTIQWDDEEQGLTVLSFDLRLSIKSGSDPYIDIENSLNDAFSKNTPDLETNLQQARESRSLGRKQDCCIMINWLITVPDQSLEDLTPLLENWIEEWYEVLHGCLVGKVPEQTVLVNSACLIVAEENLVQDIHDLVNNQIRDLETPQLPLLKNKESLGKLDETEITDFLRSNQRWYEGLNLNEHNIKPKEYAQWLIKKTGGAFESTVYLIWRQYQNNYQNYKAGDNLL